MFDLFLYVVVERSKFERREEQTRYLQLAQLDNLKHPENLNDLIAIMTQAAKEKNKMKGVSTRYSAVWNEIAATDGYLINTATYDNFI